MTSTALAFANPRAAIVVESQGFDFSDMRVFTRVPADDNYDVVALRGMVVVLDRASIHRDGFIDGPYYEHLFGCDLIGKVVGIYRPI